MWRGKSMTLLADMTRTTIDIAKDFSAFPAGRLITDGPFSGARFRDELLVPALKESDEVQVIIDGAKGYGSSFLEEAFGGLVRNGFDVKSLKDKLHLIGTKAGFGIYITNIWTYIDDAAKA